jgi:hypothetical protein
MRLISWRPLAKGCLRGLADIALPIGLKIFDVPVFIDQNGPWASLPGEPQLDREGRRKTDINGKLVYAPVLQWRDRQLADRFSERVVALVRAAYPGDLEDGALEPRQAEAQSAPARRRSTYPHRLGPTADGGELGDAMPNDSVSDLWTNWVWRRSL